MACQYDTCNEHCIDRECPWYRGGGPCDGETYAPTQFAWPLGQGRWTYEPRIYD